MKINPIYDAFFATEKRYVLLYGSAGSGKSHGGWHEPCHRCNGSGYLITAEATDKDKKEVGG